MQRIISGNPSSPGKLKRLHLVKGSPKESLPDAGCTATPSASQNKIGCEGLGDSKRGAILRCRQLAAVLCELLSHLQWCPRGRWGMEVTSGDRAQDRRTWSPTLLGFVPAEGVGVVLY